MISAQILKNISNNINKNIKIKSQIKILKPKPWDNRSEHEMLEIKRQIIYSKSTRTLYPKIKFRYGCNK